MTAAEVLALVLALAALLVALLALFRASAALAAKARLEAFIRAAQQTDIQVLFLKMSAGRYNFTLSNRGASTARNVRLQLLDELPPAQDPLRDAGNRLPVPQLDPGGYYQIPVAMDEHMPMHFRLQVAWTNAGGLESVKEVALNLIH